MSRSFNCKATLTGTLDENTDVLEADLTLGEDGTTTNHLAGGMGALICKLEDLYGNLEEVSASGNNVHFKVQGQNMDSVRSGLEQLRDQVNFTEIHTDITEVVSTTPGLS
jgi:hypothetical protein